ncbi:uncharacterized protein LOC116805582 [Drosophila grimshawi]|uniref:uncharacterized protein LOC116805582 n=1 Tax=Drosophila grimshawi TaxID=7222 RepID=UPI000C8704D5|nr:uncharacterized protein LOC116805582 [Drosophila grimshawi]
MHRTWARAEQSSSCKESHEIFPQDIPPPRRFSFVPTYEKDEPAMGLLLGWEYGRLWLKEHKETMIKQLSEAKPLFIQPDFIWWVNKRAAVIDRRQIFLEKKENPHVKNCNLTAFAAVKSHRQRRHLGNTSLNKTATTPPGSATESAGSLAMTNFEKAKKCNCKDCKQRRCAAGGQTKEQLNARTKSISIPWY